MTFVLDLRNAPQGLFDAESADPFAAAESHWRRWGLWPMVRGVRDRGTVLTLDNGVTRLQVWPEGGEYVPRSDDDLVFQPIDEDLSIGWDDRPTPKDLDNGNPLALGSTPLILADGNAWQIPEIREPSGTRLPRDMVRNRKTGQLEMPLKAEYQQLWNETEYWFDLFWSCIEGRTKTFDLDRALKFATDILSLRYRFCDAMQSALRVIDSTNVEKIIYIAIGWPAVMDAISAEVQKKS